jgi:hypothetical protein
MRDLEPQQLTFGPLSPPPQVCNTACASPDSELCRPLKSLSIGASSDGVTTFPESKAGGCGPTFSGAALNSLGTDSPSGPEHCEAFYVTAPEAGAAQAAICGGKTCTVQMVLDNGVTAAGSSGFTPSEVSPTPAPTPSPTPGPTPYGRRRSLQQVPEVTTTAYGKRRSLQQAVPVTTTTYGKRRLTQQH